MTGKIVFFIIFYGFILLSAYKAYLNSKSNIENSDNTNDELKNQVNELKQEISNLKKRTIVLEKIITDEAYSLKNEINELNKVS